MTTLHSLGSFKASDPERKEAKASFVPAFVFPALFFFGVVVEAEKRGCGAEVHVYEDSQVVHSILAAIFALG